MLALVGVLALGGASALQAQETTNAPKDTSAARTDTSGEQGDRTDSTRTDSSGFKYTGPATDTALKAKPGAQTGPTAGDTGMGKMGGAEAADSVVCRDGSNAASGQSACGAHGGIDSVATKAALKARGLNGKSDSSSIKSDTSSSSQHQSP